MERLRLATLSDAEKIAAAGKAEIAAAERAARLELKELAAKLSVDKAECYRGALPRAPVASASVAAADKAML